MPLVFDDEKNAAESGLVFDDEQVAKAPPAKPSERNWLEAAGDTSIDLAKGVVGLGESAVGLADLATGNLVGKGLGAIGYDPERTSEALSSGYSDSRTQANRNVADAKGFWNTAGALVDNPSAAVGSMVESAPMMLGSAAAARAVAAKMLASAGIKAGTVEAAAYLSKPSVIAALTGVGSATEGALTAGNIQEAGRQAGRDYTDSAPAALAGGAITAAIGFGTSKIPGFKDVEVSAALAGMGKDTARQSLLSAGKEIAKGTFKEGVLEELPQSAQEQVFTNLATGKTWNEGVPEAAAQGMVAGAGMGGGMSTYAVGRNALSQEDAPPPAPPVAGTPDPVVKATQAPEVTAAEKALLQPVGLTALDRVNDLDKQNQAAVERLAELNDPAQGYGPMFDQERQELSAKSAELAQERADLSKDWPKSVPGLASSFSTEAGARVEAQYALMDAGDLITSHDESLRRNPLYPQELQPRERDRAASEMQVSSIVQKLDPARLGISADAANGAPIVGADGLVESGNARTIALKRVYQANGQKAADYKTFLRDNAAQFGITPESVEGMAKPVLVRVRSTPVNRAEFARQANASTVAAMAPSEQAKSDANRIDSMEDLTPDDNGDFSNAASRPFVQRFMARLPMTEQAGMVDASGKLSTTGYARVRNAVLAKAYGDSPVLARMTESMDDNLRNVSRAFLLAAPKVASLRAAVKDGNRFDADITPDLMMAAEELSKIKGEGGSVQDALAQVDMMGEQRTPEAAQLLQFLNDNMRRPRRMADFISAYMGALDAAGDPNQGSLLGDTQAPAKQDLLKAAERATQNETQDNGTAFARTAPQDSGQAGQKPGAAQSGGGRPQGNGVDAGNAAQGSAEQGDRSEWVNFPKDSGTIGIPRANMPQIKGEHRGALIQFLQGRGISHKTKDVPAKSLKPTQAEFSTKKAEKWSKVREGSDRSVLVSSDGHILDGHHQWVAALAANEPIQAIVLDAPIRELMTNVFQFPSVKQSEAAADGAGLAAREDFKAAMGELADYIHGKIGGKAMMVPSDAKLQAILVKLFDSAFAVVGNNIKEATVMVKEALKGNFRTKTYWNKINNEAYDKAAKASLAQSAKTRVDDLFSMAEQRGQEDLFSAPAAPVAAPKPVGRMDGNFKAPSLVSVVGKDVAERVQKLVNAWKDNLPEATISTEDRIKAEALLQPVIDAAVKDEPWFDARVRDIGKQFLGSQLGPTKKIGRTAVKLLEEKFNLAEMKDIVRATIVVDQYDTGAQAALDAIAKKFKIIQVNNKSGLNISVDSDVRLKLKHSQEGYKDVTAFVRLPGGGIAEIQINIPEMLSAKLSAHVLYEGSRVVESDAARQDEYAELRDGQMDVYQAALDSSMRRLESATQNKNDSSLDGYPLDTGNPRIGTSSIASSSSSLNQSPLGNLTYSSPPNEEMNSQPAGNLSGTFITSPLNDSIAQKTKNGYSNPQQQENSDGNDTDSAPGDQGQGTSTAQKPGSKRQAQRLRTGTGGSDQSGNGGSDDGGSQAQPLGQAGSDGTGGQDERGQGDQSGSRSGPGAGVSAGRDIPTKSGRNYEFGPDDLTYEGSWAKKAEQNVAVVELVKALEKEGRQATRDEQKILAKFVGWGAGELANNLFGPKLDKVAVALEAYDTAVKGFDANDGRPLSQRQNGFYNAFQVLQAASKTQLNYYNFQTISRQQLDAAKPDAAAKRWLALRDRLRAALTKEELAEASRSTQYAHYTSKSVVQSMWKAMDRMGFKGGHVLEPGAGIGIFAGLMPQATAFNSSYTGIEYDAITGAILKQLFPDERILVESFVDTKLPKNFYDVAAGNPPFSGTKILGDPEYAKHAFSLHDYFFAKSIDRVKPGGLVMYVTSRYTMDKLDDKARKYLSDRADLVGAIRLPQTAFKQNAGTDVVTDVIFLRKKVPGETFELGQAWGKSVPIAAGAKTFPINEYFHAHPEMVLGKHSDTGKMQNSAEPQYTVTALEGDIEVHFAKAVENLPADIYQAERGSSAEAAKVREIDFNPKAKKEGNYYVTDAGVLMQRESGVGQSVQLRSAKDVELVKAFVPLRDALKQAHYDQLNDGEWEQSLAKLQAAYAAFTKKHGQINQYTTKTVKVKVDELDDEGTPTGRKVDDEELRRSFPLLKTLEDDPDVTLVQALETLNEDTGEITQSDFLTARVLGKAQTSEASTPMDALLTTLNDVGHVDVPLMAQRLGLSEADTIEALGTSIYKDPEAGWVTDDDYLSGNVKHKLDLARAAAKGDRAYERNVAALEANQPEPLPPSKINLVLGMNWIPSKVYQDFVNGITDGNVKARIEWNPRTKQWITEAISGYHTDAATAIWGTGRRNVVDLMEHALTGRPIRIETKAGSDDKATFDPAATEAANEKLKALKERFEKWVWEDAGRTDELVQMYNDRFNTTKPRSFDGRHLTLPGSSKMFNIFDHVKRGAWRIIQSGNTYLAHAVGSGKTFQMVISAMEQKRLGLVKKPMIVVPNHMLKQFASEWQQLYPAARLMVADENNFHMDNRRRFVSRVALSDLDGVIITHSAFKLMDLDPEFKSKIINEQLEFLRAALEEAGGDPDESGKSRDPKIKQIEKQIENWEQKLAKTFSSEGKDKNVRFDELGVDFLYVDEAHNYRKLDFATSRQVKGIAPLGSAMAADLYMKSRYLEEKTPGRSLVLASGTPITNTIAELYTVQKMLGRQAMIDKGVEDFDSWASMFGRETTALESNASGKYEPVTRFAKFANVPELTQMFREFADVLNSDHLAALLGDKRPKVEGGSRKIVITPETPEYIEFRGELEERVRISKAWKPSKDEPYNPDPMVRIITDGRLSSVDMRFMHPELPNNPDSKLNRMIDDVIAKFKETADMAYNDKAGKQEPNLGASMMVFSDVGFGAGVAASRGFNARAWMEKRMRDAGIPMDQVAFMSDYKKSTDKLKLFSDVNAGRVRVLVGSSKNMGTGVNAQQRLKALFHLDSPWFPADLEQREGRAVRQGNKNPVVQLLAYSTKGTYDEQMWSLLARKQGFIDQGLSGDPNVREIEDLDSVSSFAMAAAMVAKDPRVLQLAGLDADIAKFERLYQAHEDDRVRFRKKFEEARLTHDFNATRLPDAIANAGKAQDLAGDKFVAKVGGKSFSDRTKWAEALIANYKDLSTRVLVQGQKVGEISGFDIDFVGQTVAGQYRAFLMLMTPNSVELVADAGTSPVGVAMRAQNAVVDVARLPAKMRERLSEARALMDGLSAKLNAPFPMLQMLSDKRAERKALAEDLAAPPVVEPENTLGWTEYQQKFDPMEAALQDDYPESGAVIRDPKLITRLSRGQGGGMDLASLQGLAKRIQARMPNMPKVHVLASPADAPKALHDYIVKQGALQDAEGALHNGELYLFASGMSDALRAEHVLAEHEAAHFGLHALLGDSLKTTMQAIYNNNAAVRQAATALQQRGKLSNTEATEEAIVDIPSSELVKLKGWRKLVLRARDWLEAHGFDAMAAKLSTWLDGSLDDQQRADLFVANLVRNARAYAAGKKHAVRKAKPSTNLSETKLSTLADDLAEQEQWLMTEARARGYKDIEDLLEKDYPVFEKLALLWREKHPADGGVLLSRTPSTKMAYESKIDKLFAGGKAGLAGVKVLDRTELLGLLGHADKAVYLAEGKVIAGLKNHPNMTAATWKSVPEWLDKPAAVFESDTVPGRLVFVAPDAVAGAPVLLIVEPNGSNRDAHLMVNAYDAQGGNTPFSRWVRDGKLLYVDKSKFPALLQDASRLQLPGTAFQNKPGTQRILTEKNLSGYIKANPQTVLSRAGNKGTAAERANQIIMTKAGTAKPLDAVVQAFTKITGIERATRAIYARAGYLLDRYTPETIKAGMVADYGVPEAVIDQRAMMQGRQRVQLRQAGNLIDKLATLTRAESRVAYEWMNETDPHTIYTMMQNLPEESVKVLMEVQTMVDKLSREAVRMGQLSQDAYDRNKFAYLRRSYAKYALTQTEGEKKGRARAISILGDQYKGRGLTESASMEQIQNAAPDWWARKMVKGKADTALKGAKLIRLERRAPAGDRTQALPGMDGKQPGKIREVAYFPAGEPLPAKYAEWTQAGVFEVRDTKGANAILWRDFTKDERENMGEIDEARFAIAKTLHAMVHDVEVGRYLEWLAHNYAKKEGETIPGQVVNASERYADTFKPGEWVKVPDSKIAGTNVLKYGTLAGRYLPGPVWNDLRQTVNGQFRPFGDTYATILSFWKTSKTALSPAVHMNNIMSNFVMADWHDVTAGHTAKALRILLGAHGQDGNGVLGSAGNVLAGGLGRADREASQEIMNRYLDSGGNLGSWATNEVATKQIEPLLAAMEQELALSGGSSHQAQAGVMSALQHALMLRFPSAFESLKNSKPGQAVGTEVKSMMELYQSEDEVFRLAAWLKAKEEGKSDMEAGKLSRKSFLDYNINAPWVQAMRNSALPFISYTYRAVPKMLDIAGNKPHKLMKLMLVAGGLNALGVMLSGGDDDKERKLLPEEKAGKIWGMVPKLIRMPWNDANASPVYLDIRRFIPVGDVLDVGANHAAIPLLPMMTPGGPLVILGEVVLNKTGFTGKPITLDTDTPAQQATKVMDYLYKAFMPNVLGLPGTYASTGVFNAIKGKTDAFGREQSVTQAVASSFGVKLGSYPADVLRRNEMSKAMGQMMEIDKNISALKRQRMTNAITADEFEKQVMVEQLKKQKIQQAAQDKLGG